MNYTLIIVLLLENGQKAKYLIMTLKMILKEYLKTKILRMDTIK